ncbi:DNA-binding transcriptional LysR family regulator [Marinobacterium sp. MBR-111]|jgi:DNA-binding transcriptional LysR family regulator|uniref:LysR substrate-binding domain-containing protein n=1 Tax=Marinobacterium sp. MBR-111 TaxID=3156463 RepID=UPI003398DA59
MDLRKLKYFVTVAEEGHISRAATVLNISQPPLTRQIQQLEEELGVQLFTRTAKGMEITHAGALFLQEARNIFALIEQATERTQRAGQGRLGRLDIAIFGSGILETIPRILLTFRNTYPDVKIVLHTMDKHSQIEALRQQRITIGFNRMVEPQGDIKTELVVTEKLLLAVSDSSPLASLSVIDFREIANHPLILFPAQSRPNFIDKVLRMCEVSGFTPQISQEVDDVLTGVALVASGFGVCLVSEAARALTLPGVTYIRLTNTPPGASADLSCIYREGDKSPILEAFLATVREYSKNHDLECTK